MAHKAAPEQGLQSLGGALVRKATETGDSQAAFFLSLVPPTVCMQLRVCGTNNKQHVCWPKEAVSPCFVHT